MKKLLFIAFLSLSVGVYAQPNLIQIDSSQINDYEVVPIGSYAVPYASGEWLIIPPSGLTQIMEGYVSDNWVDWQGLYDEISQLNQVGKVASLTNLLANYTPTPSDYELGGIMACCFFPETEVFCWGWFCSRDCGCQMYFNPTCSCDPIYAVQESR